MTRSIFDFGKANSLSIYLVKQILISKKRISTQITSKKRLFQIRNVVKKLLNEQNKKQCEKTSQELKKTLENVENAF